MTREELEFEMVSLATDFVSQRRVGEAGLKVMVRMMIDKVIESKLHQPTVISSVCEHINKQVLGGNQTRLKCLDCGKQLI